MKKIGILGGMSAVSTQIYYKNICSLVTKKLGDLNSPELIIRSLNFEPLAKHMHLNQWDSIAEILNFEAKKLEQSGADFIILATNTMHKLADKMMSNVSIPLLHIADATADELKKTTIYIKKVLICVLLCFTFYTKLSFLALGKVVGYGVTRLR